MLTRFENSAALAVGLLLPMLETWRRGFDHWGIYFTTMFEDYLAGVLLLVGVWATLRKQRFGPVLLLVAWTWVTGMMTISFVDQVETSFRGVDVEPHNSEVLVVKFALFAVSAVAMLCSFRRVLESRAA